MRPASFAALPGRILAPLLLAMFALFGAAMNYALQLREFREQVTRDQQRWLAEILGIEQTRLEIQTELGNTLQLNRLVAGLALRSGVTHALLVDADGQVVGATSRTQLNRPLTDAIGREDPAVREAILDVAADRTRTLVVMPSRGDLALVGQVSIHPDLRLIVRADLARPLAVRISAGHFEIWRETALILLFAAMLAVLLNVLWFRRSAQLTAAVAALGEGRLDARVGLAGRDELAQIGHAIDRMAADLETRQANLQRLSELINRSPVVAIEWRNEPGRPVAFVSDSIRQWGYTPEELLSGGLRYADLMHPEDRPGIEAHVARHVADGPDDYRQEYRLRNADGDWIWLDDRTWLTRDDGGAVTRIYGVLLDITAIKESEAALLRLNATLESRVAERTTQLEIANRELESFSYAVSHDLKAPLRGIDGYSQILLEDYRDRLDDEGRQFLANIRRGVAQMHELIEDLLAYANIERRPLEARPVSLQRIVGEIVDGFAQEIAGTGAEVSVEVGDHQLSIDRAGLGLVLRNLIGNALKFSRAAAPPRIGIAAGDDGRHLTLRIRDNGIGFDMKYHDRIFDIFQRLHRAEDYPGTGVGLALVRKALQRMGGAVRAESEPGKGSTFFVELPR